MQNMTTTTGKPDINHPIHRMSSLFIDSATTEADYTLYCQVIDQLLSITKGDEQHPLASIIDFFGDAIQDYEAHQFSLPEGKPLDVLHTLMDQYELSQSDLPEIGNQAKVSEILNGKRELNKRQIQALSKRFGISPSLFF